MIMLPQESIDFAQRNPSVPATRSMGIDQSSITPAFERRLADAQGARHLFRTEQFINQRSAASFRGLSSETQ